MISNVTYPVEHLRPALEGDALEHGDHGVEEVVEIGDAMIRAFPPDIAPKTVRTNEITAARSWIVHDLVWKIFNIRYL